MIIISKIDERAVELACYIIENKATIREAAAFFGIGKSTAHEDLSVRLPQLNRNLYNEVKVVLDQNFAERQSRGGRGRQRLLRLQKGKE